MADNPLKQLSLDELRRLAALQRSGQLPPAAVVGMGFDPQTFDTDLREALREGMRVPYEGPPGAPPVPPRAEPAPAPAPTLPAPASDIADRMLRRMIPIEPPAPPTEVDIFRSTGARPPRLTPEMLASQQAEEATMAGPPRAGEGVRSAIPAPPATPADPYAAVRQYLGGGGGGMGGIPGPTKFTMPTRPADLNEEEARRKLSVGMPGEREAQETYKADPYMTMLQTGLRILAAEPKLGQSAISAIAGPVAEGTEKYMTEKEKERLSKREEAKEEAPTTAATEVPTEVRQIFDTLDSPQGKKPKTRKIIESMHPDLGKKAIFINDNIEQIIAEAEANGKVTKECP